MLMSLRSAVTPVTRTLGTPSPSRMLTPSVRTRPLMERRLTSMASTGAVMITLPETAVTSTFRKVDVNAVSGNVIITAPVEAMDVNLRSISGRVRTEGVNIREGGDVPSVRVTGVTADLKLISIKE